MAGSKFKQFIFGTRAQISERALPPSAVFFGTALFTEELNAPAGVASYCADSAYNPGTSYNEGVMLFGTDGATVWNSTDEQYMDGATLGGLGGDNRFAQGVVITPNYNDANRFWIFALSADQLKVYVSTVLMTGDGGKGTVDQKAVTINLPAKCTDRLGAFSYDDAGTTKYGIILKEAGNNKFHVYKAAAVTGNNPNMSAVVTTAIGSSYNDNDAANNACIKFNRDATKVATIYQSTIGTSGTPVTTAKVEVFDFNKSTSVLSNYGSFDVDINDAGEQDAKRPILIPRAKAYDLEWEHGLSNTLYVPWFNTTTNKCEIRQVALNSADNTLSSSTVVPNSSSDKAFFSLYRSPYTDTVYVASPNVISNTGGYSSNYNDSYSGQYMSAITNSGSHNFQFDPEYIDFSGMSFNAGVQKGVNNIALAGEYSSSTYHSLTPCDTQVEYTMDENGRIWSLNGALDATLVADVSDIPNRANIAVQKETHYIYLLAGTGTTYKIYKIDPITSTVDSGTSLSDAGATITGYTLIAGKDGTATDLIAIVNTSGGHKYATIVIATGVTTPAGNAQAGITPLGLAVIGTDYFVTHLKRVYKNAAGTWSLLANTNAGLADSIKGLSTDDTVLYGYVDDKRYTVNQATGELTLARDITTNSGDTWNYEVNGAGIANRATLITNDSSIGTHVDKVITVSEYAGCYTVATTGSSGTTSITLLTSSDNCAACGSVGIDDTTSDYACKLLVSCCTIGSTPRRILGTTTDPGISVGSVYQITANQQNSDQLNRCVEAVSNDEALWISFGDGSLGYIETSGGTVSSTAYIQSTITPSGTIKDIAFDKHGNGYVTNTAHDLQWFVPHIDTTTRSLTSLNVFNALDFNDNDELITAGITGGVTQVQRATVDYDGTVSIVSTLNNANCAIVGDISVHMSTGTYYAIGNGAGNSTSTTDNLFSLDPTSLTVGTNADLSSTLSLGANELVKGLEIIGTKGWVLTWDAISLTCKLYPVVLSTGALDGSAITLGGKYEIAPTGLAYNNPCQYWTPFSPGVTSYVSTESCQASTTSVDCCYKLIECDSGASIYTQTNLAAYADLYVNLGTAGTCYKVHKWGDGGCLGAVDVTVVANYGSCELCNAVQDTCYRLLKCGDLSTSPVYTTSTLTPSISAYVGRVVQLEGENFCRQVDTLGTTTDLASAAAQTIINGASSCSACKFNITLTRCDDSNVQIDVDYTSSPTLHGYIGTSFAVKIASLGSSEDQYCWTVDSDIVGPHHIVYPTATLTDNYTDCTSCTNPTACYTLSSCCGTSYVADQVVSNTCGLVAGDVGKVIEAELLVSGVTYTGCWTVSSSASCTGVLKDSNITIYNSTNNGDGVVGNCDSCNTNPCEDCKELLPIDIKQAPVSVAPSVVKDIENKIITFSSPASLSSVSWKVAEFNPIHGVNWFWGKQVGLIWKTLGVPRTKNGGASNMKGWTRSSKSYAPTSTAIHSVEKDVTFGLITTKEYKRGDLLFYSDGREVFNSSHERMTNCLPGQLLDGGSGGDNKYARQQCIVVPDPSSGTTSDVFNKYYLVYNTCFDGPVKWSKINMNTVGGLGEVELVGKNTELIANSTERLAVTSTPADGSNVWWILECGTGATDGTKFRAHKVSSTGIAAPVTTTLAGNLKFNSNDSYRRNALIKVSPDNKYISISGKDEKNRDFVQLYTFNYSTGVITFVSTVIKKEEIGGVEFSPDSKYLYYACNNNTSMPVLYRKLIASNTSDQKFEFKYGVPGMSAPSSKSVNIYDMQIGPDYKMYVSTSFGYTIANNKLLVLNNITNENINDIGVYPYSLNGKNIGIGLPQYLKRCKTCNSSDNVADAVIDETYDYAEATPLSMPSGLEAYKLTQCSNATELCSSSDGTCYTGTTSSIPDSSPYGVRGLNHSWRAISNRLMPGIIDVGVAMRHQEIVDAIADLSTGEDQFVYISYSWVAPGSLLPFGISNWKDTSTSPPTLTDTRIAVLPESGPGTANATGRCNNYQPTGEGETAGQYGAGYTKSQTVTFPEFVQEVDNALRAVEGLFNSTFNTDCGYGANLTLKFLPYGDNPPLTTEANPPTPSAGNSRVEQAKVDLTSVNTFVEGSPNNYLYWTDTVLGIPDPSIYSAKGYLTDTAIVGATSIDTGVPVTNVKCGEIRFAMGLTDDARSTAPAGIVDGVYATCLRGYHQFNTLQDKWQKGGNLIIFDVNENWRKADQPNIIIDNPDGTGQILNVSIDAAAAHEVMHAMGFQHFTRQEADYDLTKNAATAQQNEYNPPITADQFDFTWWRNYGPPEQGGNTLTRFGPPFGWEEYYRNPASLNTTYVYTDPNDPSFVYDWTPAMPGNPFDYSFPMGQRTGQTAFPWGDIYTLGRIPETASIMQGWGQGLNLRDFYIVNGMPSAAATGITAETAMNWSQVDKRAVCGLYGNADPNFINMDGQCNVVPEIGGQVYYVSQAFNSTLDNAAINGGLVVWDPGADATSPTCTSCWYVEAVEVSDISDLTLGLEYQVNIEGNVDSCEDCEPAIANITCVKLTRCDTTETQYAVFEDVFETGANFDNPLYTDLDVCTESDVVAIGQTGPEVIWTSNADILSLCTTANASQELNNEGNLYVQLNEYPNVCYKVECQTCLESEPEPESTGLQAPAIFLLNETPPRARHSWGISDNYQGIDWSELGPQADAEIQLPPGFGTSTFNINYHRMSKFFEASDTPDSDIVAFGFQYQPCVNNQVFPLANTNVLQGTISSDYNSTLFLAPSCPESIWNAWRNGGAVDVGNYLWQDGDSNNSQSRCAVVIGYTNFDLFMMFHGSGAFNNLMNAAPGYDLAGVIYQLVVGGIFNPPLIHLWQDHPISYYEGLQTYTGAPMNNFRNCVVANAIYDDQGQSNMDANNCYAYAYVLMKETATVQSYNWNDVFGPFVVDVSGDPQINPFAMLGFDEFTQQVPYGFMEYLSQFDPEDNAITAEDIATAYGTGTDHHLWNRTQKIFSVDTEIMQFINPSGCASSTLAPIQNNFASLTDGNPNPIVFGWPETYGVQAEENQETPAAIPSECSCNSSVAEEVTMYASYISCGSCCNTVETCFTFTNCQDPDDTFVAYISEDTMFGSSEILEYVLGGYNFKLASAPSTVNGIDDYPFTGKCYTAEICSGIVAADGESIIGPGICGTGDCIPQGFVTILNINPYMLEITTTLSVEQANPSDSFFNECETFLPQDFYDQYTPVESAIGCLNYPPIPSYTLTPCYMSMGMTCPPITYIIPNADLDDAYLNNKVVTISDSGQYPNPNNGGQCPDINCVFTISLSEDLQIVPTNTVTVLNSYQNCEMAVEQESAVFGCNDEEALNYDPCATVNNGTCNYPLGDCMDPNAINYNPAATFDDGSCLYPVDPNIVPEKPVLTFEGQCKNTCISLDVMDDLFEKASQMCDICFPPKGLQLEPVIPNPLSTVPEEYPEGPGLTAASFPPPPLSDTLGDNVSESPDENVNPVCVTLPTGGIDFDEGPGDVELGLACECQEWNYLNNPAVADLNIAAGTSGYNWINAAIQSPYAEVNGLFNNAVGAELAPLETFVGQGIVGSEEVLTANYGTTVWEDCAQFTSYIDSDGIPPQVAFQTGAEYPCGTVLGCTDQNAYNWNPLVTVNIPSSCCYTAGCTDPAALNFDPMNCFSVPSMCVYTEPEPPEPALLPETSFGNSNIYVFLPITSEVIYDYGDNSVGNVQVKESSTWTRVLKKLIKFKNNVIVPTYNKIKLERGDNYTGKLYVIPTVYNLKGLYSSLDGAGPNAGSVMDWSPTWWIDYSSGGTKVDTLGNWSSKTAMGLQDKDYLRWFTYPLTGNKGANANTLPAKFRSIFGWTNVIPGSNPDTHPSQDYELNSRAWNTGLGNWKKYHNTLLRELMELPEGQVNPQNDRSVHAGFSDWYHEFEGGDTNPICITFMSNSIGAYHFTNPSRIISNYPAEVKPQAMKQGKGVREGDIEASKVCGKSNSRKWTWGGYSGVGYGINSLISNKNGFEVAPLYQESFKLFTSVHKYGVDQNGNKTSSGYSRFKALIIVSNYENYNVSNPSVESIDFLYHLYGAVGQGHITNRGHISCESFMEMNDAHKYSAKIVTDPNVPNPYMGKRGNQKTSFDPKLDMWGTKKAGSAGASLSRYGIRFTEGYKNYTKFTVDEFYKIMLNNLAF